MPRFFSFVIFQICSFIVLHNIAGDIFYDGCQNSAKKERENRVFAAAVQTEENYQSTVAVDGAYGPVQKTPLLTKPALADGTVDHLAAPAQYAVDHQKQKGVGEFYEGRRAGWGIEIGHEAAPRLFADYSLI